jgi:hypothetical protein
VQGIWDQSTGNGTKKNMEEMLKPRNMKQQFFNKLGKT